MKIICDCGEITKFVPFEYENTELDDDDGIMNRVVGKIEFFEVEHEQIGITCNKCNNTINIFT